MKHAGVSSFSVSNTIAQINVEIFVDTILKVHIQYVSDEFYHYSSVSVQ